MNITVFGSSDLTLEVLEFLHQNSYTIGAIVTIPQVFKISYNLTGVKNARFTDLSAWGKSRNIPVIIYQNSDQSIQELTQLKIQKDFAIAVGWYHMVPEKLRSIFSVGFGGFHSSLLPKLRGGAPLSWAILLGLEETGVSFFELGEGVDDGRLYDQEKFHISHKDTVFDLIIKSRDAICKMLQRTLPKIQMREFQKYPQQGTPSYCGQRTPQDGCINWEEDAHFIVRLIKSASHPYEGAYGFLGEEKIIIWDAQLADIEVYGVSGQIMVIENKIYIACGHSAILVLRAEQETLLKHSNHKKFKKWGG